MRRLVARIHQVLAGILMALIATQIYFAGMALFGAGPWGFHIGLGWMIWLSSPVLLITALAGWLGRRAIGLSALVFALTTLQVFLPRLRVSAPFLAAYHPVNAMVLLTLAYLMTRKPSQLLARESESKGASLGAPTLARPTDIH